MAAQNIEIALALTRRRGPGIRPWLMALRTAVEAEPAPSVPMSRSAVKPAIRSCLAAKLARMVRCGFGFLHRLQVFGAGMQEQMHMRVDQARHQGGVAQIDHFRARRMTDRAAHRRDAVALDQDLAGRHDAAAFRVEQARGMQHNGVRRRRRGILCPGAERQKRHHQRGQGDATDFHGRYPLSRCRPRIDFIRGGMANCSRRTAHYSRELVMTAPSLDSLPTPCLLLDQARLARNAERMRARTAGLGVTFRPHLKTAKSVDAAMYILGTPPGPATVSTLKEAEVFGAAGITDLLYAVCISPQKLDRVDRLRQSGVDLKIILDFTEAAKAVAAHGRKTGAPLPVLIEIDVDDHRSGVHWNDRDTLLAIAEISRRQCHARGRDVPCRRKL